MAINTLEEKFAFSLNSIYDAEHQFLEAQHEPLGTDFRSPRAGLAWEVFSHMLPSC